MSEDTTRATRLTILIAGNGVILSRIWDMHLGAVTKTVGIAGLSVSFIGMTAAYLALRNKTFRLGEVISCLCILVAMAAAIVGLLAQDSN